MWRVCWEQQSLFSVRLILSTIIQGGSRKWVKWFPLKPHASYNKRPATRLHNYASYNLWVVPMQKPWFTTVSTVRKRIVVHANFQLPLENMQACTNISCKGHVHLKCTWGEVMYHTQSYEWFGHSELRMKQMCLISKRIFLYVSKHSFACSTN